MCGLYGLAGYGILGKHLRAFKELMWVSALRGTDSTGVYAVKSRRQKPVEVLRKDAIDSADFIFKHDRIDSFLKDMTFDLFMGHVRDATVGSVTQANAHPFDVGSMVGAHNGTIKHKDFFSPKKTDSEMMFQMMASIGVRETLEKLSWWDAYAVSIYDRTSRTLILARNDQRSLYMGISEKDDIMMYASDLDMLRLVNNRNSLGLKYYIVSPGMLFTIKIDEIKVGNLTPYHTSDIKTTDDWSDLPWDQASTGSLLI